MHRSIRLAWVFALFAFVAVATAAFASPPARPVDTIGSGGPVRPTTAPGTAPAPGVILPRPIAPGPGLLKTPSAYVGAVAPGTRVPLSRLPHLPTRTPMNTATPKRHTMLRPMAASGAYIDITGTNCGGQGALGDQFNVGCTLVWQSGGLTAGDVKQDYLILNNNANEQSATATGGTYTGTAGAVNTSTLSSQGTYVLGVYDVSAGAWIAIIYVNAGTVFSIKVYQDPFHTQETYQFDASSSGNAYIYLQNVAQSDYYVVGVNQTSVAPNCVFMAPAPLPSPYSYSTNQLCQLTASSGVQAPGGNLSVTWPITSNLSAGTYSVEVYDLTAGVRLGQVQVSITGTSGLVVTLKPDASGPRANPSPNPAPAATAGTVFDWDGRFPTDESVTGFTATINGATNGSNYQWTMSDPQGQVIGTQAATVAGNANTSTFVFDSLAGGAGTMLAPGQYPANSFTVQLYDTTHKNVIASQGFKVLGYSTITQFSSSGTLTNAIAIANGNSGTTAQLVFTNNSNGIFNNFGDNLREIEFSTGPNFNASATTGNGIMIGTTTSSASVCNTTCTTTATDSKGNSWNETITCSAGGLTKNGECNVLLVPANASTTLAPGDYVTTPAVTFFNSTSSTCGNACQAITSELPQNGIKWSSTTNALAWQPVYFRNSSASESATATFKFIGSINQGTRNALNSPYTPPFVGTHYFQSYTSQADYNDNSPYSIAISGTLTSSHDDIMGFTINNTGNNSITQLAIALPSLFLYQGYYAVDALSSGTWAATSCPANFSAQWICFNGGSIGKGSSGSLFLDQALTLQSFPFSEIQMEAYANAQWYSVTPTGTTSTTPDGRNTIDSLAMGLFSLIGTDMGVYSSPSTVGQGSTTTLGFTVTNTSTSVDPNPDSVDLVVLEAPSTGLSLSSTPSVSNTGWSYLGSFKPNSGTTTQYWFGLCSSQFTTGAQNGSSYGGPPAATNSPKSLPLSAPYPALSCGSSETNAVGPGTSVNISNMTLSNFNTTGAQTWKMFAHGANSGGWSAAQSFTLTVAAASASVWFNKVAGATVATNTVPTIGGSPNTYQYAIKNTSQSTNITSAVVVIPGLDINNQNAFDGTNTWSVNNITSGGVTLSAPSGQADGTGGCVVDTTSTNTYNPTTSGTNGQISIKSCTSFKPGDILYVNYTAVNPSSQSDTYVFPAYVNGTVSTGTQAGTQWLGSDEVTESFSVGLNVVVNPSNPGPGGSTPVVSCGNTCAFSGTTIDFGNILNNQSFTFQDVVRTSIIYSGATTSGHTLDLYVSANTNPANSTGSPTNELLTSVDSSHSTTGAGLTFYQTTYGVVPTSGTLHLASAPETYTSTGYDIINNFEVSIGAESISSHIVTLTYTLIAN